jgi:hypothetical protein
VAFAGFSPRTRRLRHPKPDVFDCASHLMGTSARTDTADSCTQARQGNRPAQHHQWAALLRTRNEPPVLDKQKDSACSKVWVDRFGQSHRHAHGRRDEEEMDICIVSLDDVGNSHQQFTVMPFGYQQSVFFPTA